MPYKQTLHAGPAETAPDGVTFWTDPNGLCSGAVEHPASGALAQSVSASGLHPEGSGFEFRTPHQPTRHIPAGVRVSPLIALREMGFDISHPCRGHVLVEGAPLRRGNFSHYAFRHAVGSGRVKCRAGRLLSAYKQPLSGLWIFCLDAPDAGQSAWETAMGMRGYAGSPAEREDRSNLHPAGGAQ